ncbi:MAG: sulfotransferase domain-containing protein [Chloroflexota bacterium]|nr:sulfotransferase domain-containing protein [Chloroflexota bacterium]
MTIGCASPKTGGERTDEEHEPVRIIIAGPPKAGNVWLKCLLGTIYQLRPLTNRDTPQRPQLHLFKQWLEEDKFPDGTIFHQHYDYQPELVDLIDAVPAHVATIIRDPYDGFVSSYFTIQGHQNDGKRAGRRTDVMAGKPLDDPAVISYLRNGGFRNNMRRAQDWLESGRSLMVRYERLHDDPIAELRSITDKIESVPDERIAAAIETCSAENMRNIGGERSKHVRAATVGDSREKLNDEHLTVFREKYADMIRALGYEVR